jgi:hypothetical protein
MRNVIAAPGAMGELRQLKDELARQLRGIGGSGVRSP